MKNRKGFTLIELIVVTAILGILALFLVPSFLGYTKDAQKATCDANRNLIERSYSFYKINNADVALSEYIENDGADYKETQCPSGGVYTYDDNDEKILCSIHHISNEENKPEKPEDEPEAESGKIPGTDLDVDYEKVYSFQEHQLIEKTYQAGTIIEMKDNDGNIIDYFILKDPTWIGTMNSNISGLLKLTNDKAVIIKNTGASAIKEALGDNINVGTKILYNGKYYICRESANGYHPIPGENYIWLEIK